MIDIHYMLIFGVIGYLFKKLDYPIAPMVLALGLGSMAESALRHSLIMSHGNPDAERKIGQTCNRLKK